MFNQTCQQRRLIDTAYDCVIVVTSASDQHMLSLNS